MARITSGLVAIGLALFGATLADAQSPPDVGPYHVAEIFKIGGAGGWESGTSFSGGAGYGGRGGDGGSGGGIFNSANVSSAHLWNTIVAQNASGAGGLGGSGSIPPSTSSAAAEPGCVPAVALTSVRRRRLQPRHRGPKRRKPAADRKRGCGLARPSTAHLTSDRNALVSRTFEFGQCFTTA